MRHVTILVSSITIILSFYSCSKNDAVYKNVVFLEAASIDPYVKISADSTGASYAIKAAIADPESQPFDVEIAVDTTLVEQYNKAHAKSYKPLPQGSYRLSGSTLSFSAGSSRSSTKSLEVLSTKDFKDGESYLAAITIKNSGPLAVLAKSKTLFIEVSKILFTRSASLKGNYFIADFSTNNDGLTAMQSITIETRVMAKSFYPTDPYISAIMGVENVLMMRFGDVIIKSNQLQVYGSNFKVSGNDLFEQNTWYHLAVSYNGSELNVYVNGVLVATQACTNTIDLVNSGWKFTFGREYGKRGLDGAIGEARVWKKALSQSEIINGMCGVDPANTDLVAYWKFNETSGKIAYDISGNGHNATANSTVTWQEAVRCN